MLLSCKVWPQCQEVPAPVYFCPPGKRQRRHTVVALCAGRTGRLLFIQDTISGRRFLCDSGAQSSILPASAADIQANRHGPPMEAANGTPIRTYGTRQVSLGFGGQQFNWDFVLADVSFPLIGADFLCAYGLLVDVKNRRLIDAATYCSYACTLGGANAVGLSNMLSATDEFLRLLA